MNYNCKVLSQEKKITKSFGEMYHGNYYDKQGVRNVGYVCVYNKFRGQGYFHLILETFKTDMNMVILYAPNEITLKVAVGHGYVYDEDRNVMVWRRGRLRTGNYNNDKDYYLNIKSSCRSNG